MSSLPGRLLFLACLLVLLLSGCSREAKPTAPSPPVQPTIKLQQEADGRFVLAVVDLSSQALADLERLHLTQQQWQDSYFWVRVVRDDEKERVVASGNVLGSYVINGGKVIFAPRFPLQPGVTYRADFCPTGLVRDRTVNRAFYQDQLALESEHLLEEYLSVFVRIPGGGSSSTVVAALYPTPSTLPENLLKFYIHFSAPMSRGEAYQRIHLLDAAG
jgi:hypothetical protein